VQIITSCRAVPACFVLAQKIANSGKYPSFRDFRIAPERTPNSENSDPDRARQARSTHTAQYCLQSRSQQCVFYSAEQLFNCAARPFPTALAMETIAP
jgi:hypothetical protein